MKSGAAQTFPEMLDEARQRFATRTAYIEGRRSLTWQEFGAAVDRVAAALIEAGLQKGDRVAICAENSIDWITAYQATAKAGGAGALVYYDLKPHEIEQQVRHAGSRYLFASAEVLSKLPPDLAGAEHVFIIGAAPGTLPERATPFADLLADRGVGAAASAAVATSPDDLAVIVYTSGTTGGAKGVMLSHRNVLSNARAAAEALDLTENDSSLLVLPMHHAMPFIAAVVLPPLIGAHFVIENDLRRIRDRLQEHKPTIFFGVPALYELVYRNVLARAEAEGRLQTLQSWQKRLGAIKRLTGVNLAPLLFRSVHKALGGRLRFLISGGAALNTRTALDFAGLGLPLLQGWGMSEASPVIAVQRFSPRRFRYSNYYEKHAGSVGPPLPGVEVKLVDVPEKGISVADSGEGEVLVRGDNVFLGYWRGETETAEAKRDGWLHTGDLARIDAEGNIFLTGRSKYAIVLESGEKVQPEEMEEALAQSSLIEDVCVTGRQVRDKTQVAAIIYPGVEATQQHCSSSAIELNEASLRRLVQAEVDRTSKQMAAYKRVSLIELSDQPLPKTALRKVARGHVAASYEFDFERWLVSAPEPETTPSRSPSPA